MFVSALNYQILVNFYNLDKVMRLRIVIVMTDTWLVKRCIIIIIIIIIMIFSVTVLWGENSSCFKK